MKHFGFKNTQPLLTRSFDGRNCIVQERLVLRARSGRLIRTAVHMRTDGGSLPPLSFIGGAVIFAAYWLRGFSELFDLLALLGAAVCVAGLYLKSYGRWWWSYVFHDGCFQGNLEISSDDGVTWRPYAPTEPDSNYLLYQAMASQGARWWEYTVVFIALQFFGWRAFDDDRKKLK